MKFQTALLSLLGARELETGKDLQNQKRSINLVHQPQRWPKVGNAMAAANVH